MRWDRADLALRQHPITALEGDMTPNRLLPAATAALATLLAVGPSVFAQATPASPSAHAALATNPVGTCPYWSELDTSGAIKGKTPQAIAITKQQVGAEWEVVGRARRAGIALYSGMVQILANKPPFGWGLVRYVWLHAHNHGRTMTARFPLEAGQIFRSVVCGRHAHASSPHQPHTGPGSSCKQPVKSILTPSYETGGIPAGAQRHIPITYEVRDQGEADYFVGRPPVPGRTVVTYVTVSFSSDPSVVICKATLALYDQSTNVTTRRTLPTGPHEDTPFVVGENGGYFTLTVEGRYVKRG